MGVGTRVGKGRTSDHGVCSVGSASGTSIVGVITILTVASPYRDPEPHPLFMPLILVGGLLFGFGLAYSHMA